MKKIVVIFKEGYKNHQSKINKQENWKKNKVKEVNSIDPRNYWSVEKGYYIDKETGRLKRIKSPKKKSFYYEGAKRGVKRRLNNIYIINEEINITIKPSEYRKMYGRHFGW